MVYRKHLAYGRFSLQVSCVPPPKKRGEMLSLCLQTLSKIKISHKLSLQLTRGWPTQRHIANDRY